MGKHVSSIGLLASCKRPQLERPSTTPVIDWNHCVRSRDKVKVTRFDVQGLSHQLTGMGIEVEVEVHFVDIFRHLWYIFIKQI